MNSHFYKALGSRVFATASAMLSGLVSLKLYGRYLTPELYGLALVALQIMSYLPLVDGGFRTATNRALLATTRDEEKAAYVRFCQILYSWLAVIVILISLLVMFAYGLIAKLKDLSHGPAFFMSLGLASAMSFITWSQVGLLVGLQAQTTFYLITGFGAWITVGSLWFFLSTGAGLWSFPLSSFATVVLIFPAALLVIRKREPSFQALAFRTDESFLRMFRNLKSTAVASFRTQFSILLLFTIDVVIVAIFCGAAEAAIYGVVSRIVAIVRSFVQATGEVSWPIVAKSGVAGTFPSFLMSINAWIIGSTVGAMSQTLTPFLREYMGVAWTPPAWLVFLLALRLLITGTSAPASYMLIGLGKFKTLAQLIERELAAAVIFALLLGWHYGMNGVALAFLVSTAFGTFAPMFVAYSRESGGSVGILMLRVWSRVIVGFAISVAVSSLLVESARNPSQILALAALGVVAAIGAAIVFSILRLSNTRSPGESRITLSTVISKL